MFVASDATEYNIILFTTLESIDACYLDFLVQIFAITSVLLHCTDNVRSLTFVGCDDADLTWLHTGFEKLRNNLFAIRCLRPAN